MFDKIGKDSKDLLGKNMDTHRKFSFAKKDIGTGFLPKFSSATTDSSKGLASTFTLEGPVPYVDGVTMKNEAATGLSSYTTEIGINMKALTQVSALDGLDVTITADEAQKTSVKAEYTSDLAAVCVDADPSNLAGAAYSVGLAPAAGISCGFSGKGAAPPSKVAVAYSTGGIGCFVGLSGSGFSSVEARGIYTGIDDVKLAAKVSLDGGAYKGATVGAVYKVDGSTTAKIVTTDKMALKTGVTKSLADGVSLTVGHAVDGAKIADTSAHTLGWTLEIK